LYLSPPLEEDLMQLRRLVELERARERVIER
jgi:hypothetical protein